METYKRRIPALSVIASIVAPGMGHVYNGQPAKGFILLLVFIILELVLWAVGLLKTFYGLLAMGTIMIAFIIIVAVNAVRNSRKINQNRTPAKRFRLLFLIVFIILAAFLSLFAASKVRFMFFKPYKIPTNSMSPTLEQGDFVIADMFCYNRNPVKVGDLIIFTNPFDEEKEWVKRVIAVEGDKVEIRDKVVYVNDTEIIEPYILHIDETILPFHVSTRDNYGPTIIPEGDVFVMGDNRDNTQDSRLFGPISLDTIEGKLLYVYFSANWQRLGIKIE